MLSSLALKPLIVNYGKCSKMISSYTDNPYSIIHTGNITTIYTYVKNLPKSHEFEAVEGKNGYTQRFYQQSLDARTCARYAFSEYNITRSEILSDIYGKPVWPEGIIGSLSHCEGCVGAAIAHTYYYRSIGIDIEENYFLPIEIIHFSLFDNEIKTISMLKNSNPTVAWDRLFFSAKEAVYKAISYAENTAIPFTDIEISLLPIRKFRLKSIRSSYGTPVNGPIPSVTGEWRILQDKEHRKQFILTTACMHNNSQTA